MATVDLVDNTITSTIDQANTNALTNLENGNKFLQNLLQASSNIDIPYIGKGYGYTQSTPAYSTTTKPKEPDYGNMPTFSLPELNVTTDNIQYYNLPDIPPIDPLSLKAPEKPNVDFNAPLPDNPVISDVTIPNSPEIKIPELPTFEPISIDTEPNIEPLSFNETAPIYNIPEPNFDFSYIEQPYSSNLKDALRNKLIKDIVEGGTGLSPEVEQEIYDRQKERDELQLQDTIEQTMSVWASRGFPLPNGILESEISKILIDYEHTKNDRSRDIAINQAELEQKNVQQALTTSTNLEQIEMQFANEVNNRALQVSRYIAEFAMQFYNTKVAAFNARLEAYKTMASVFETKIRSQMNQIEIYKAKLESSQIKAQIQKQQVDIYNSQVNALMTLIDIYKTKVEAARIISSIEKDKIDIYRSQIEGYTARINAEAAKLNAYNSEINAYQSQVSAYRTRVESIAATVNTYKAQAEAVSMANQTKIQKAQIELDKYKTQASALLNEYQAYIEKIRAIAQQYSADISAYSAEINENTAKSSLEIENRRVTSEEVRSNLQISLEQAKSNLAAFVEIARIREAAAKGGSDIYAAMANASLNAINTAVTLASKVVTSED